MKRGGSIGSRINEKVQQDFRDLDVEYQLVAFLLRVKPQMCSLMRGDWLSDGILRDVYGVLSDVKVTMSKSSLIREMKSRNLVGDVELLEECLKDLYDNDVLNINDDGARHLVTQILKLYDSRRILEGVGDIVVKMKDFDLGKVRRQLKALAKPEELRDNKSAGYYLGDYMQRLDIIGEREKRTEDSENGQVGIPTGIYRFDKLCGGIMPGEFGVIAGMTGVGKTLALGCFAVTAWLSGHNVMLVSGEMNKATLEFRIDSNLAGIPAMRFRNAELSEGDLTQWDATIKKYEAQMDNYLYIATFERSFSTEHIENTIIRVQEESGQRLDWLGIDYLNIMIPVENSGGGSREWVSQTDVVWDVNGLTAEYNLATWSAGQVRDEAYNKDSYDPSDLKYARAIGETAPIVVALIRTDEDMLANRMRLQVLKMRSAKLPKKPIMLSPNMDIMRLHQSDKLGKKSLADITPEKVKTKRRTKHTPPKRSLKSI